MTRLQVEFEDFVVAARSMYDGVAEPVRTANGRLADTLSGLGCMAGDDPGGQNWSSAYDPAARAVLRATGEIVNAAYTTTAMFGRSAMNYAEAEVASTAPGSRPASTSALLQKLPGDTFTGPVELPASAAGGSGDTPTGWGLIEQSVGYIWPNGHQDKLRRAANAWKAAADDLESALDQVNKGSATFADDRLPEAPDITAVCQGMADRIFSLSRAHRSLALACDELADHIDTCHASVRDALHDLVIESAGIQMGGALLSTVTLGGAEAGTQTAQGAKIYKVARAVAALIEKFISLVKNVGSGIKHVAGEAERVAADLSRISRARLTTAHLTYVRAVHAVNEVGELAATRRLASFARPLAKLQVSAGQLEKKFKHASVFGVTTARGRAGFEAFRVRLEEFLSSPGTIRTPGTYRKSEVILSYNKDSSLLVIQNMDGSLVSCWKMRPDQLFNVLKGRSIGGG